MDESNPAIRPLTEEEMDAVAGGGLFDTAKKVVKVVAEVVNAIANAASGPQA